MKRPHTYSYIKGTRQRGFFGGYKSLWLAEDHLLLLRSSGWADRWRESSRRFYFRDIQALIFCEDKKRRNLSLAFLGPALFFLLLALLFQENGYLVTTPLALFFLLLSGVNWFKGPTCKCLIQTAVQSTSLPCTRLRSAQKLKKQLKYRIEKAQGHFDEQHIYTLKEMMHHHTDSSSIAPKKLPAQSIRHALPHFNNRAHILAFLLLLGQAATSLLAFQGRGQILFLLETCLLLASLTCLITALYRQSRSQLRGILIWITWIALGSLFVFLLMNFGLLVEVIKDMSKTDIIPSNEYEIWRLMAKIEPANSPFLRVLLWAKACTYTVIGIAGMILSITAAQPTEKENG